MSLRLELERHAEDDLTERAAYIARENPVIAQAFLDAVERAFTRLADIPAPAPCRHPHGAWPGVSLLPDFLPCGR